MSFEDIKFKSVSEMIKFQAIVELTSDDEKTLSEEKIRNLMIPFLDNLNGKINKLEKQLEEAEKELRYYADPVNHQFDDHRLHEDEELMEFFEVQDENGARLSLKPLDNGLDELFEGYVAGRRAREYFKNKGGK